MTEADVADLPTEAWRDGKFRFDDYLTESLHTGTIEVVEPDEDDDADDQDDDWRWRTKYLYSGRAVTYDELRDEVETEAAGLPPEQWIDGEFVFDAWLANVASSGLDTYDPAIAGPLVDASIRVTPLKRFAQEAEVSAAIVYLLSPAAAYLTGTCIRIDGGASLNPNAMDVGGGGVGGTAFRGFHRASEPEVLKNHQSGAR